MSEKSSDIVFIKELKIESTIGIFPHEKILPQTLIIDLEMECDLSKSVSDKIEDTLDYAAVCNLIIDEAKNSKAELLEKLAFNLIDALFANFSLIDAVRIQIRKPSALEFTRNVGINIRRTRA
ncbi:MAG: dihydroneopterin aldolase [Cardiobacteriaceae bacterium]|nr:dihydroneopterin aldolase [Cardiobacteriaceae bacterium]